MLRVRYGQPPGCPVLAALARNRGNETRFRRNINFDGTKLRLERSRPKTTTYGMNRFFAPLFDQSETRQIIPRMIVLRQP